ncbi:MAG: hypothetical protein ACRDQZ_01415 [Mycobacteriales bacterium]
MPSGITHVVETVISPSGRQAYVLLAIETVGRLRFYLDENICHRAEDGSWHGGDSGGGGWTSQTLEELRADPPPQGMSFTE